ncbi:isoaspartyl peptidase/L-asparaginase family protein [Aliikangiella coralliicola]|uniref:Isoaspartyl peptidase n=1 Tax=Aliikangiella coralliicola TaxID=2592383 RepID=A0A545U5Z6_9GAMM|nr:isoaspartyl peptidase/L-asparaginase [Aliikangiella coralliicola]TQV84895.1 isoaspartyl peptidase/L-asparaginase [Aliikangiella coralliicola]
MRINKTFLFLLMLVSANTLADNNKNLKSNTAKGNIAIAIHGGAGTILKANMTPELEKAYHAKLAEALKAGYQVLKTGGSSVNAVQAAIVIMEDSPLFNAGKGAVFTHDKTNELDASIMEGKSLNAGAISGVSRIKNPIKLATLVMNNSKHVMLSGQGAEEFANSQSVELVSSDYFHTDRRWNQLLKLLKDEPDSFKLSEDKDDKHAQQSKNPQDLNNEHSAKTAQLTQWPDDDKFGTVGAVALDHSGNLAAGTSTGGMTNKKFGRIGDSPIIGAGTYADNQACAISATGHGEYFIRAAVAHDICARVKYKKVSLQQAADEVIQEKLKAMQGDGGIVGMSPTGEPVFSFNSSGMYRGYIDKNGKIFTAIYQH